MPGAASPSAVESLGLLGFSGIANLLSAVKVARYFELDRNDVLVSVLTESMWLYGSRLEEMTVEEGPHSERQAAIDFHRWLLGQTGDGLLELTYPERHRVHNLKYFIWVERQGKSEEECRAQWYHQHYWTDIQQPVPRIDELIVEFNRRVGILGD